MSEAKRYNAGKPKLGYFARSFHKALEAIARVKEFGANKYEEDNWRLGNKPDSEYLDSMARHLDLFQKGEQYDEDSGCHHLGHAIWNLCALLELNYGDADMIDEPLFRKQIQYWADKKKELDNPIEKVMVDKWAQDVKDYPNANKMIVRDDQSSDTPGKDLPPLVTYDETMLETQVRDQRGLNELRRNLPIGTPRETIMSVKQLEENAKIRDGAKAKPSDEVPVLLTNESVMPRTRLEKFSQNLRDMNEKKKVHPYVDGNGNPLTETRARELKASGVDIFNRVPESVTQNVFNKETLARIQSWSDALPFRHHYTTEKGVPISVEEADRRHNCQLPVQVARDEPIAKKQQKGDFNKGEKPVSPLYIDERGNPISREQAESLWGCNPPFNKPELGKQRPIHDGKGRIISLEQAAALWRVSNE